MSMWGSHKHEHFKDNEAILGLCNILDKKKRGGGWDTRFQK